MCDSLIAAVCINVCLYSCNLSVDVIMCSITYLLEHTDAKLLDIHPIGHSMFERGS